MIYAIPLSRKSGRELRFGHDIPLRVSIDALLEFWANPVRTH